MEKKELEKMIGETNEQCKAYERNIVNRVFQDGKLIEVQGNIDTTPFIEKYQYGKDGKLNLISLTMKMSGYENIFEYDKNNVLLSKTDIYSKSTKVTMYDSLERETKISSYFQNGDLKSITDYLYNNNESKDCVMNHTDILTKNKIIRNIVNGRVTEEKIYNISGNIVVLEKHVLYGTTDQDMIVTLYKEGHLYSKVIYSDKDTQQKYYDENGQLTKISVTKSEDECNWTTTFDSKDNILESKCMNNITRVETTFIYNKDGIISEIIDSHYPIVVYKNSIMRKIYYTIKDEEKDSMYRTEDYKFNGTDYILIGSKDTSNKKYISIEEYKYDVNNNIIESIDTKIMYDETVEGPISIETNSDYKNGKIVSVHVSDIYSDGKVIVTDKDGTKETIINMNGCSNIIKE